jgi:hypothetical protein
MGCYLGFLGLLTATGFPKAKAALGRAQFVDRTPFLLYSGFGHNAGNVTRFILTRKLSIEERRQLTKDCGHNWI